MDKKISGKYNQIIIAAIMSFVMALASVMPVCRVQAKKAAPEKTYFFSVYPKMPTSADDRSRTVFLQGLWQKPITDAESSDEDVFTVDEEQSSYNIGIKIARVKKKTSAELSFKVWGKEYTTDIVVKPYVNPCKAFRVGSKDFKKKFDKTSRYHLTRQKKNISGKTVVKAKKGWEVKEIVLNEGFSSGKRVKIKNESTGGAFWTVFKNKETKEEVWLELFYSSLKEKGGNEIAEF